MFVRSYGTIATSHMPSADPDFGDVAHERTEAGYLLHVEPVAWWNEGDPAEPDPFEGVPVPVQPEWLLPILQLACSLDLSIVFFDCDGSPVEGLPVYRW